jgi:hypothetical protein
MMTTKLSDMVFYPQSKREEIDVVGGHADDPGFMNFKGAEALEVKVNFLRGLLPEGFTAPEGVVGLPHVCKDGEVMMESPEGGAAYAEVPKGMEAECAHALILAAIALLEKVRR